MRLAIAAAGLVALTSITAAQTTRRDTPVPFAVGETLTYDVTYSSYLVAGTAVSKVEGRRSVSGASSYDIVVEGRPIPMLASLYSLSYRMQTFLDTATLLPHRSALNVQEGVRKRTSRTMFDRTANRAFFEVEMPDGKDQFTFDVPQQVQDGLSALYVFRTMSIKQGDTFSLPVADEGSLYMVNARVGAPERLAVPLGTFDAVPLNITVVDETGKPAANNAAIWISTDSRRLPLKMQADLTVGTFVLLLRTATP